MIDQAYLSAITAPYQGVISHLHQLPYVCLEGLKGTGKSTLMSWLIERLQAEYQVILLHPTQPFEGEDVLREALKQAHQDSLSPEQYREHFYAARSAQAVAQASERLINLNPHDLRPPILLGDRSFYTSLVTRWHRVHDQGFLAHYQHTRTFESTIPIPSLVIYLSLPFDDLRQRLETRGKQEGAQDETEERLLEAQQAYEALISASWCHILGQNNAAQELLQTQWVEVALNDQDKTHTKKQRDACLSHIKTYLQQTHT